MRVWPEIMLQVFWIIWGNILSQICSSSIFECTMFQEHIAMICSKSICKMHSAPWACLNMLLEQCTFTLCSWSILNLEYYPRLFMLREQLFLEHNFWPKSHRSILEYVYNYVIGLKLIKSLYIPSSLFFFRSKLKHQSCITTLNYCSDLILLFYWTL